MRRSSTCRPAGSATPTCTTARAASTTTSRSCSGHEAAGVVSAVGEGVTNVAVGDYVILNWRAVCGQCRACAKGKPWYCFDTHNAAQKMTLADGTELSPALGIGAFAEKTLVHSGQCTKVDPAAPPTAAGLLGCGVMAGIGAAINTGGVGPRRHRRRLRLRRRRGRRDRRLPAGRGVEDHRRRHRRPEARVGRRAWAPPTRSTRKDDRPGRGDQGAHRRLRGRRRHRRRRAPGRLPSRRSTPATSPAPSSSSACRTRR